MFLILSIHCSLDLALLSNPRNYNSVFILEFCHSHFLQIRKLSLLPFFYYIKDVVLDINNFSSFEAPICFFVMSLLPSTKNPSL